MEGTIDVSTWSAGWESIMKLLKDLYQARLGEHYGVVTNGNGTFITIFGMDDGDVKVYKFKNEVALIKRFEEARNQAVAYATRNRWADYNWHLLDFVDMALEKNKLFDLSLWG